MRASGILLPITALPGEYGIGCFSKEALKFVDFLKESKQYYWQILPIGPTGFGNSPYQSYSTYAISPLFIDMEALIEEGVLTNADCESLKKFKDTEVMYEELSEVKIKLLRKAYENRKDHRGLEEFASKEAYWLDVYGLFMALHEHFDGESYTEWPEDYSTPNWEIVDKFKEDHADEINFHRYVQYKAYTQWKKIKEYANENNVKIIGDLPIYVSPDSSDVWIDRKLFQMNEKGEMENIAGCPGDDYAPDGQLWGNPLYDWDYHKNTGYNWWISRMKKAIELYDVVRIDHFRGLDEYFSIPAEDKNANRGKWLPGPGMSLFTALKDALGEINVIAEDLGFLTDTVRQLRKDSKYPGMKVIQFAYGYGASNEYLPHLHVPESVVYTGTHDNPTTLGWLQDKQTQKAIDHIIEYHGFDKNLTKEELVDKFVAIAFASVSNLCIIPLQDWLVLDNNARINTPSTVGGPNWRWRVKANVFTPTLSKKIKALVELYGR